ncbi:MAG: hypothetical protein IIC24_06585 [Chloroflexi bacterium]|nr:hypothetical protein [Chloroflexota bacterium]
MLTIAGVAATGAILNAIFPVVGRSTNAVVSASATVDDRLKSDISVVHIIGELDSSGAFSDTNGNGTFDIFLWVKNVGETRIQSIDQTDLFLGKTGSFTRIPHETEVESDVYPRWNYTIENDTEWGPKATIKITVSYDSTQTTGNYDSKVIIPNGISDEYFFSL